MNKDNIISVVPRISVATKKSARTNNDYTVLVVHFGNGYELTQFLNKEQQKLVEYAIKESQEATHPLA
ncbi:MAG TPA: hypothetical protein PLU21_01030 [Candidatus Saccharibacteria bacterium]|mgnify:CR=1 FL=1|nr:hypothetical protein [Candidatus Saccharibacteria bacterium]